MAEQRELRAEFAKGADKAKNNLPRLQIDWSGVEMPKCEIGDIWTPKEITIKALRRYINWRSFHNFWKTSPHTNEGCALRLDADRVLDSFENQNIRAVVRFVNAHSDGDNISLENGESAVTIITPRQRRVGTYGVALSLADFVAPKGYNDCVGLFAVTVPQSLVEAVQSAKSEGDDYRALLLQSLSDRVVEAASEYLHRQVRYRLYRGYSNSQDLSDAERRLTIPQLFAGKYRGIRPAVGYSCLPEQRIIFDIARLLPIEDVGISLTESGAMYPQSSVCGLYIDKEWAKYFIIE
jgi:5-methyltetrahydrofolate--homocysteine methyltransferase